MVDLILKVLFWSSVFMLYMVYHGYGELLKIVFLFKNKKISVIQSAELPFVTVLLTVFNEERKILNRLDNLLDTDYPLERLQILVASDGSRDRTHEIVEDLALRYPITLFVSESRLGKTGTQNQAIKFCMGDFVIFTDADTEFSRKTIYELVAPFSSSDVGATTGHVVFRNAGNKISEAQTTYWDYELVLRSLESRLGILAVMAGPCMAVRKSVLQPMPEFVGEDCVVPLQVAIQGYQVIHCHNAVAFDMMDSNPSREFKTRVRMTLRNWMGTLHYRQLLNPVKYPGYAFSLYFHKIFRWLSPVFLIVATITTLFLATEHLYALFSACFILLYVFAILGWILEGQGRKLPIVSTVFAFILANCGFMVGLIRFLKGQKIIAYQAGQLSDARSQK